VSRPHPPIPFLVSLMDHSTLPGYPPPTAHVHRGHRCPRTGVVGQGAAPSLS
jgi:hypothetical protein